MNEVDGLAIAAILPTLPIGSKIALNKIAEDIYELHVEESTHCTNCGGPIPCACIAKTPYITLKQGTMLGGYLPVMMVWYDNHWDVAYTGTRSYVYETAVNGAKQWAEDEGVRYV